MPRRKIPKVVERFDVREIGRRLERDRKRFGIPVKAIAAELWPQQGENAKFSWYKKAQTRGSRWELDELAPAVEAMVSLGRRKDGSPVGLAPSLYPLVDWEVAEAFDNWLKRGKS